LSNDVTRGGIRSTTCFTYLSSNPVGKHSCWSYRSAEVSSWLAACTVLSSSVAN